jgi:hypothetical protein
MNIVFPMAASGAIVASSANTWLAGSFNAAPGQVNGIAATSDNFRLTGVVVLPGIEAPTAAQSPLIMRPYDQELLTCQRYWKKNADALGHWHETSPTQAYFSIQHEPPMRAAPTVTVLATANRIYRPSVAGYNIGDNTGGGTAESTWINLNTATAVANVPAQLIPDTLSFDARL